MGLLSKTAILTAEDLKHEDVQVAEWGGEVRVRSMTGTQRSAFGDSLVGADGKSDTRDFRLKLIVACAVDENGEPLFTVDDLDALSAKSGAALERVFNAASRLNGVGVDGVEAAKGN